jgi:tetratricopeptide (TPR) repeat protein
MANTHTLLARAEEQFLRKDYTNALKIYGLILRDNPQIKEAEMGAYLSDLGLENGEDAQALFDYYQVIKKTNEDAEEVIDKLMQAIRSTRVIIQQLSGTSEEETVYRNGIRYDDFLQSIQEKGDFARAFEDVMFSTRVVIRTQEEFIDFITRLIEAGQHEVAANYLDAMAGDPRTDQAIYALYRLLPEGT